MNLTVLTSYEYSSGPGPVSYRGGKRFNDRYADIPGPGSYNSNTGLSSSTGKLKGGKWGIGAGGGADRSMALKSSLGKSASLIIPPF